ncbi:MAG TPA: SRPBCC family protein [Acidimicrobiales bacterium]|nr:SRPBCC family protein [Acidimicrobiales bacterium]
MADEVHVTRDIAAAPDRLWAMVSDVTRMGEWSPESEGATWLGGADGPQPGAKFRGLNRNGKKKWETESTVVEAEPGRLFAFRVTAAGFKVAEWRYSFEPTDSGCRVTESWIDQRGRIAKALGKPVSGVSDRATHNRAGMEHTLDRLKAEAESASSPG